MNAVTKRMIHIDIHVNTVPKFVFNFIRRFTFNKIKMKFQFRPLTLNAIYAP